MTRLAISGGEPTRKTPLARWPQFDECEKAALMCLEVKFVRSTYEVCAPTKSSVVLSP